MKSQYHTKFLITGGIIALILSLFLFGALILSAIYNQYRDVEIAVQSFTGKNLAQNLSRVARLGIEPQRIADLDTRIKNYAHNDSTILIINNDNKIITKWNYTKENTSFFLPTHLKKEKNSIQSFTEDHTLWLIYPVLNRDNATIANVLVGIDNTIFSTQIYQLIKKISLKFLIITLCSCILLIFLTYFITTHYNKQSNTTKKQQYIIFSSLLIPLLFAQIVFGFFIKNTLFDIQEKNLQNATKTISAYLIQDIQHIENLGLSTKEILPPFAKYTQSIQDQFTWIKGIQLTKNNENFYIQHGKIIENDLWQKNISTHDFSISYQSNKQKHTLHFLCSSKDFIKNLYAILLDTLTITFISFVFMVEMLHLLLLKEEQRNTMPQAHISQNPKFMRSIIFLCIFGTSMPISFLPLRMAEISTDFFGFPKDVVMGLPLSCETFVTGISLFFGGILAQKKGWRPLMLWGSLLVTLGSIGSGLATSAFFYILSRCISGYGYGYIYLMSQVFVIAKSNLENRTANISAMLAGLYAGLLCGSPFGGLIADKFGYSSVFFVIAFILSLLGLYTLFFVPKETIIKQQTQKKQIAIKQFWKFFKNPKMASLLLFHIIPCAFVTTCLFQFYIPISLDTAGVSPAGIGRISMLFCVVIVYIGPYLGIIIDRSSNKALWIFYADSIGILAIMALAWIYGIWAAIIGVLLLGICNTIVYSVQGVYALELPASKEFGEAQSMTVYNVAERIGQVLGPITLGITISLWGSSFSLYLMATLFLIMCFAFLFIAQKK